MTEEQRQALQQIYDVQTMAESNAKLLQQRLTLIQDLLNSYRTGLQVLKEMENRKPDDEMLMNVGGNITIKAKIVDNTTVIRSIGSNVRIEQSVEEAKKGIEDALERLEKQHTEVNEEYQKLMSYLTGLNAQFQELASQMQQQQPGE